MFLCVCVVCIYLPLRLEMMDVNIGSSHGAFCLMRSLGTPPVFGRPFPSLESFSSPFKKKKYQKFSHRNGSIFPEASGREEKEHSSSRLFLFFSLVPFVYSNFDQRSVKKGSLLLFSFSSSPPYLALSIYIQSLNLSYRYPGLARKRIPKGKNPLCSIGSSPAGDSSAAKKKKKKRKEQQQQQ